MRFGTSFASIRFGSSNARSIVGVAVVPEPEPIPPVGGASLTVTWENTSTTALTNLIEQSLNGSSWSTVALITAGAAGTTGSRTVTGLDYNTAYYFRVSAVNGLGSATISSGIYYTAPEMALVGVVATDTSYSTISISATAPINPPINGGYLVEYYQAGDPPWLLSTASPTLPVTISGITESTLVTARVYAYNLNADGSKSIGPVSATVSDTTPTAPVPFDDFNRADGLITSGNSDWETSSMTIVSNQASNSTSTAINALRTIPPTSNNHYSEVVVGNVSGSRAVTLLVRKNTSTFYSFSFDNSRYCSLDKGGSNLTYPDLGIAPSSGDIVRLSVSGSSPAIVKVHFNGVEKASYSDSSSPIASGNYGFALVAATGVAAVNSWAGGNA